MAWLLIALPALSGIALLVAGRRADPFAPVVAIVAGVATIAVACGAAADRPAASAPFLDGIPISVAVDGLSAVLIVVVAAITTVVLVFAAGDLGPGEARARFFGLMLLFAGAMLATVTAESLVTLLMAWEMMGAASYALIGYWWRDDERATAGLVAFLTTRTGDLGLYLAAGAALAGGSGDLSLTSLASLDSGWRDAAAAGVVLAALGKSAQLPFSFWLSRAMAGPSPVSALLHSATMVAAGGYLLLRLEPLLAATSWALPTVAWVGAATAIALGAVAACQTDLKQLLAASTCAQMGVLVLAAGVGGVAAGTGQLVAHAVTKSVLFLAAGAWLTALGTKNLTDLAGAARRYPVVGAVFTVGSLSLAGIPPLSLWITKDEVLAAAWADSKPLYVAGLAAAVLATIYAGRALVVVWQPADRQGTGRVTTPQSVALVALAAGVVGSSAALIPSVRATFVDTVGRDAGAGPALWEFALSGALAVATLAVVVGVRGKLPTFGVLAAWLHLERLAHMLIATPTRSAARLAARFDDEVLDRGVQALAASSGAAARMVDRRGERFLDGAVRAVADATRTFGRWARRPQTGRLHQYYAQAVIGLVLLAVVLLTTR